MTTNEEHTHDVWLDAGASAHLGSAAGSTAAQALTAWAAAEGIGLDSVESDNTSAIGVAVIDGEEQYVIARPIR